MKKYILIALLMCLFGQASAATIYISQSGSGDGSTYANAAAYTYYRNTSAPGDIIYVCGTITSQLRAKQNGSAESPIILYSCETKYGASTNDPAILTANSPLWVEYDYNYAYGLIFNGAGTTATGLYIDSGADYFKGFNLIVKDYTGYCNFFGTNTLLDKCDFLSVGLNIQGQAAGASSGSMLLCRVKASTKSEAFTVRLRTSTNHPTWSFYNNDIFGFYADTTYPAVSIEATGGASTWYNNNIVGGVKNANAGHSVTNTNNNILPFHKDPGTGWLTNVTPGAGTIYQNPKFTSYSRHGYVIFSVDDASNVAHAQALAAILAANGKKFTYTMPAYAASTIATELQALNTAGHDIAVHSYSHSTLTTTGNIFSITSPAGQTIDIDKTGDQIVITGVGAVSGLAAKSLTTIRSDLTALGCTLGAIASGIETNSLGEIMADSSGAQASPYTPQLLIDATGATGFFQAEVATAKSTVESVVGGGFTAKTFIYPGNYHDANVRQAVKTAGFIAAPGAAGTGNTNDKLKNFDIYQFFRLDAAQLKDATGGGSAGDETSVRTNARAMGIMCAENGLVVNVMIHGADTFSEDQLTWTLEELLDVASLDIVSVAEFAVIVRDGGSWTTADDITYARATWTDESDYQLALLSLNILSGTQAGALGWGSTQTDIFGNTYFFAPYDRLNIGADQQYSDAYTRSLLPSAGVAWR